MLSWLRSRLRRTDPAPVAADPYWPRHSWMTRPRWNAERRRTFEITLPASTWERLRTLATVPPKPCLGHTQARLLDLFNWPTHVFLFALGPRELVLDVEQGNNEGYCCAGFNWIRFEIWLESRTVSVSTDMTKRYDFRLVFRQAVAALERARPPEERLSNDNEGRLSWM